MTNIKARILMNIRSEVRNHLLHGETLPTRDPVWNADIAIILAEETIALKEHIIKTQYRPFHAKYGGDMPFDAWLEISNSLYTIVGCVLTSIAKGPDHMKEWKLESHGACHKKKLTLIKTKLNDHFVRGYGFMYIPEKKI